MVSTTMNRFWNRVALGLMLVTLAGCSDQGHAPVTPPAAGEFTDALAIPTTLQASGTFQGAPLYKVVMRPEQIRLHGAWAPTALWTYNGEFPGPTINVAPHERIYVEYRNALSGDAPLSRRPASPPADLPMMMAADGHTVHLHGASVLASSDGTPQQGIMAGQSAIFQYDNDQRPAMQWYHDHILGNTRKNIYAGLAGLYVIRDPAEKALSLPQGAREVPLVLQDRQFTADGSQFVYPEHWQTEFFGDTPVVNGRVRPFLAVDPGLYRLRLLNASNARFYHLTLSSGQPFTLIGSDGGLLARPVTTSALTLAPAERADVIVDFSHSPGRNVVLLNDAPTPYPAGKDSATALTRLMQFQVGAREAAETASVPDNLGPIESLATTDVTRTRTLALRAFKNSAGPTVQFQILNPAGGESVTATTPEQAGGHYLTDPVNVDSPRKDLFPGAVTRGTTELWNFVNTTGVTHPMHVHLQHFQVVERQLFNVYHYLTTGELEYLAAPEAVTSPLDSHFDPGMLGWKDTVRADPGYVTRVLIRFEGTYTGEYVVHCHILEHEDNDMMRAFHVE